MKSPAQTPATVKTPVTRGRASSAVKTPQTVPGSLLNTPVRTHSPVVVQTPAGPRNVPQITPIQTPVRHPVRNQPNQSPAQLASRKLIQKVLKC